MPQVLTGCASNGGGGDVEEARWCYHGRASVLPWESVGAAMGGRDEGLVEGERHCFHGTAAVLPWEAAGAAEEQRRCSHARAAKLSKVRGGAIRARDDTVTRERKTTRRGVGMGLACFLGYRDMLGRGREERKKHGPEVAFRAL